MHKLNEEANQRLGEMQSQEVKQFNQIDSKFKRMKDFEFETQLRELVAECIAPIRVRVLENCDSIGSLNKDSIRFKSQI